MNEDADEFEGAAEFLRELADAFRGMVESFASRPAAGGGRSAVALAEAAVALLLCFFAARMLASVLSSFFAHLRCMKQYAETCAAAGDPWGIEEKCRELGARIDAHTGRKDNSLQVGVLAYRLTLMLGICAENAALYFYAAQVCDAGFLDLQPDLLSSDVISGKEKKLLRSHVLRGIDYYDFVPEQCMGKFLSAATYHHENIDGSGIPEGLCGNDIPPGARILHVAESFVALVNGRGYHHAFGRRRAIREMRHQKTLYDQQVVEALACVVTGRRPPRCSKK
ncbi:MAG: hypothetical protein II187_05015 [Treponema sp.]|nr:hypothetical protein [Treponema sp.]